MSAYLPRCHSMSHLPGSSMLERPRSMINKKRGKMM
jgi:hypothetical protein